MADTLSTPIYYYQKPGHVIAAAAVLPAMDTLAVVFRFVARKKQGQDLRADDFFMIPALVRYLTHQQHPPSCWDAH